MKLFDVTERVKAACSPRCTDDEIKIIVRHTIAEVGLAIDTVTGEVYNPAAQDRVTLVPIAEDNSRKYSGRLRRRR